MNERRGVRVQFRHLVLVVFVAALSIFQSGGKAQDNPVACGREDDRERGEDKVACECYREHDPCDKDRPETRKCGS